MRRIRPHQDIQLFFIANRLALEQPNSVATIYEMNTIIFTKYCLRRPTKPRYFWLNFGSIMCMPEFPNANETTKQIVEFGLIFVANISWHGTSITL